MGGKRDAVVLDQDLFWFVVVLCLQALRHSLLAVPWQQFAQHSLSAGMRYQHHGVKHVLSIFLYNLFLDAFGNISGFSPGIGRDKVKKQKLENKLF